MLFRAIAALLFLALLASCAEQAEQAEQAPPAPIWQPLEQAVEAYQSHSASDLADALAPPLLQQSWHRRWERLRQQPVSDAFREQFAERVQQLIDENGERVLSEWLLARARSIDQQKQSLLPALRALLLTAANLDASQAGEDPALAMLDRVLSRLQNTALADRFRLQTLSTMLVTELRQSAIRRWSDVESLSYEQLLLELDRLLRVVDQGLMLYEMSVEPMLASLEFELLEQNDRSAQIQARFVLFDQVYEMPLSMVRREAGWYLESVAAQAPPEPPSLQAAPSAD
jgi:hypothetical protein